MRSSDSNAMIRQGLAVLLVSTATVVPAELIELRDVAQISAGTTHSCFLTAAGGVMCRGSNYPSGQLGDGTVPNIFTRVNWGRDWAAPVVGLSSGVVAVEASRGYPIGQYYVAHSCAILASGGVKCWGSNGSGQLGDGTTTDRPTPVDVIGLPAPVVAISAGSTHTCALLSGGTLKCWGDNYYGQLGDGTNIGRTSPADVVGLTGVVEVAAAGAHTCAVTSAGAAYCWGANEHGEVGDGTTASRLSPVQVASLSSGVVSIATGGSRSTAYGEGGGHSCAIMAGGGMKCWGLNNVGQLGDGTLASHLTPFDTLIAGGALDASLAGSIHGTAYFHHSLSQSCTLLSIGQVVCSGANICYASQPGCQTVSSWPAYYTYSPQPVTAPGFSTGVVSISANGGQLCGVFTGGGAKCWPYGSIPGPFPILTGTAPQALSFGPRPTLAVGGSTTPEVTAGGSGNPVILTSLAPTICSVSGERTVQGLAQGVCRIAANQGGNAFYDPAAEIVMDFRVGNPFSQTITFGAPPVVAVGAVGVASASASSGLPVVFASNTPGACTVAGNVVTGVATGNCTISARQSGDYWYAVIEATQTFPVGPSPGTKVLSTAKNGSGVGRITSSPDGIDCGSVCASNFPSDWPVTLSASGTSDSRFAGWSGACAGLGSCVVTMDAAKSVTATFEPNTVTPRLANISTRMKVLTGDDVLIGGFIIEGSTPKTVVVRARGPSMNALGVPGTLANPKLQLFSGNTLMAANDDWEDAANAAAISASGFAPSIAVESAILITLDPGPYTAIVSGSAGGTGIGLVEVFEVDNGENPLINIATRGKVLAGNEVMIAGFIIQGNAPKNVIVRARGPSLRPHGIPRPLLDPYLELYSAQGRIALNDNWQTNSYPLSSTAFAPSDAYEAAIQITLNPGAYTVIVSGAQNTTGVAIVEVFAQ